MKFWQCVVAALLLHMAILMIPITVTDITRVGEFRLVISETVSTPSVSAVVPAVRPPQVKKPKSIIKPKSIVKPKPKPKPPANTPEIKPLKRDSISEPVEGPSLPAAPAPETIEVGNTDPVEEVPCAGPEISQTAEEREPVEMSFGTSGGPKFLKQVQPVYPRKAKMLRKRGVVTLMLTIDKDGTLIDVEVVKGAGYGFDEESIRAVKESTFIGARKNGRPIACKALLPVRFRLR